MVNVLEILAKYHSKGLRISRSFGLNEEAEDLVQNMYIKIYEWKGKYDKTLMYNEKEVNHYFVFLVLRNLFLDQCKTKKNKVPLNDNLKDKSKNDLTIEYKEKLNEVKREIESWHLYDRKIYELLYQEGYSMLELSKKTGIDYYNIYRTKKKIVKLINQKLGI